MTNSLPSDALESSGAPAFEVVYQVRSLVGDDVVATSTLELARSAEVTDPESAAVAAVAWAHDNDPSCDPSLDPVVEVLRITERDGVSTQM